MSVEELPPLTEWVTMAQAAEVLGLSRMALWKMADKGQLKTAHIIGHKTIVFAASELEEMRSTRAFKAGLAPRKK